VTHGEFSFIVDSFRSAYGLSASLALFAVLFAPPRPLAIQDKPAARPEASSASIGLVFDNSKSMINKRNPALAAMLQLVQAGGPQDEFFVINFNTDSYLDQDFTTDKNLVNQALQRMDPRGGTALNDALLASGDHLKKSGKYNRKILVLLTDGSDNSSHASTANVLDEFKKPDAPVVYCIGLFREGTEDRTKKMLKELAQRTGGAAFFPKDPDQLHEVISKIAKELHKR
jgi:VWFA-related protein